MDNVLARGWDSSHSLSRENPEKFIMACIWQKNFFFKCQS